MCHPINNTLFKIIRCYMHELIGVVFSNNTPIIDRPLCHIFANTSVRVMIIFKLTTPTCCNCYLRWLCPFHRVNNNIFLQNFIALKCTISPLKHMDMSHRHH